MTALGVVVIEQVAFRLADERTVEHDVGEARIRLDGRERTTLVIFGPDDAEPLLGATTLQLFNMAVVTIGELLFSVPGLLKRSIPPEMHDAAKLANSTTYGTNPETETALLVLVHRGAVYEHHW